MTRPRFAVVGSGMFVSGRGTGAYGTILPALASSYRDGNVETPVVFVRSARSAAMLEDDRRRLARRLGWDFPVETRIATTSDEVARALGEAPFAGAIVSVPDAYHRDYALACLEAAVPVQMVKPLAPTVADCIELVRVAESGRVHAVVEYHKRHDLMNLKLREAWLDVRLGAWLHGVVEYSQQRRIPLEVFRDWAGSTNIFHYLGVHYVDVVRFATGGTPLRAMAIGQYGVLRDAGIDTPDTIQAIVEFSLPGQAQRFSLVLHTGWNDPNESAAISYQRIQVVGTGGRLNSEQRDRGHQLITPGRGVEDVNCYFTQPYPEPDGTVRFRGYGIESVLAFVRDARRLAAGDARYEELQHGRATFREATYASAVAEAVARSLALDGTWIDVDTAWA